jgi:hypothetical protein
MSYLIGHLIGDYLLQNDWMAANKKRATLPCLVHVLLYTLAIAACTGWPLWALAVVAVTHFAQDRTQVIAWWMRINRQEGFAKPPLAPWSVIVVDNTWHLVTLHILSLIVGATP